MARHLHALIVLATLQVCIYAASNVKDQAAVIKLEDSSQIKADTSVDSSADNQSEATKQYDDKNFQGQRQKRFNNDFFFDLSPFGTFPPHFYKRYESKVTGVLNVDSFTAEVSRRVQDILSYTRQRAQFAQSIPHIPIPYIPVQYLPPVGCRCRPHNDRPNSERPNNEIPNNDGSPNNERPNNDESPNNVPIAQHTTPSTLPPINKPQSTSPALDDMTESPTRNDDTSSNTPDLFSRLPDMNESDISNEEDGARPISFERKKPKKALSRPPPPVEHGSTQEGKVKDAENDVQESSVVTSTITPAPVNMVINQQPSVSTNERPSLCDGAVLTCCHQLEVTYECFVKQGCPEPTPYSTPCDENVILDVIRKFQYYYANIRRQG